MPTYEYKCKDCGYQFEKVQRMVDDPLTDCPECAGALKRLIGAGAGLLFKGSGFYITDYRSPGYKSDASKEGKPKESSGGESKAASSTSSTKSEKTG